MAHPDMLITQPPSTHEMLTLHFSQVWSLGGVAEALEVGKEAWGLSELGTKAGVPPGRGGTQTHETCLSTAEVASCTQ